MPLSDYVDIPDPLEGIRGPRQRPEYRRPLPPEQSASMRGWLTDTGLSGLSWLGSSLNKPGRAVRGVLGGRPHEALAAIPFSDSLGITDPGDEVTGRDLTDKMGLTSRSDHGWGSWAGGLAADFATDPLMYWTGGAGKALTAAGRGLKNAGALRGVSRARIIGGIHDTESALTAAGRTPEYIRHLRDQGKWIATPAEEAAATAAGGTLEPGRALGGLGGFGLPFAHPSYLVGTGRIGKTIARGLDAAGDYAKFGNPIGRTVGALFDPEVGGAVDAITQRGWKAHAAPAAARLAEQGRRQYRDVLSGLDPLIAAAAHPEAEITSAAHAAAEGVGEHLFDPALVGQVTPLGRDVRRAGQVQMAQAREVGAPLGDVADQYAHYAPRHNLDVSPRGMQIRNRAENLYPMASGANLRRDALFRDVPGGTARIDDWFKRFAGNPDLAATDAAIRADMAADVTQIGRPITPGVQAAIDAKAPALARRIASSRDLHVTEQLPFYTPDLAANVALRGKQHARTTAAAEGAVGTIGDRLRAAAGLGTTPMTAREFRYATKHGQLDALRGRHVAAPDAARALGLRTTAADANLGTPIEGAMVQLYRRAAKLGAGPVDPFLSGPNADLRRALAAYALPADELHTIARQYQKGRLPESLAAPIRGLDSFTNMFKGLTYPIWIPSHVRNLLSAVQTNWREGTPWSAYGKQLKVMTGRGGADLSKIPEAAGLGTDAAIDAIRREQYATGNIYGGHTGATDLTGQPAAVLRQGAGRFTPPVPGSGRAGPTGNLAGDVANLIAKEGIFDQAAAVGNKLGHLRDPSVPWGFGMSGVAGATSDTMPALKAGRVAGTNIEDFVRGANWIGHREAGASGAEAAARMNRAHFDYDALTRFEKDTMRRVFPFYTFMKKNLPYQLDMLASQPAFAQAQLKPLLRAKEDQYVPDYLASGVAIPTGQEADGRQQFISSFGLPLEEAFDRWKFQGGLPDVRNTALAYLGMSNPLLKGPTEQLFNTQFHSGRKLSDLRPPAAATWLGRQLGDDNPQLLAQVLSNTPATRFVTAIDKAADPRKPWWAKALNLGSGVRITDVDMDKARAIEQRKALEGLLARSPHVSQFLNFYVKPDQAANLTPQETERLRLLAEMQAQAKTYAEGQRVGVRRP